MITSDIKTRDLTKEELNEIEKMYPSTRCSNCQSDKPGYLIKTNDRMECVQCGRHITCQETASNNGGSTDYYKFKPSWTDCQDVIEDRSMNFSQGNIFKSAFCFNISRHSSTSYERELNKIIWFAQRELDRIKK